MKIIILGPAHPLRGGIADFNEALAEALQKEGDEVIIHSFSYQYPKFLFPGTSQFTSAPAPSHLTIFSDLSSVNPLSWFKVAANIIEQKPDLVVVRYWLPFMAPALGTVAKRIRRKNIKVIAITDNVLPHEKRPGDRMLTKYFINQCDGFITMSRAVNKQLEQFTDSTDKIFLPHPVYNIFGEKISKASARNNLAIAEDEKVILFFGFIRKYKGLHLLFDAMKDNRIRDKKIRLIVAGEFYEDRTPYIEKISSENLGDSILLHTGYIDKDKVKDYFCAADLVVQPYLDATQSGITQIAYYFGRPMLVTDVGGLAEIVTHNRVGYVTEKTPGSIADAINDFYDNDREKLFSENVEADKKKFSWEYFINGLKKLYDQIS